MWLLELVVSCLIDVVGYNVARLILPLVSFGRIRVAAFGSYQRDSGWTGGRRDQLGRIELGESAAGEIGFVICAVCLAVFLYFA